MAPPLPDRPCAIVGDIHGQDALLADLIDRLVDHSAPADTDLVLCGDYVDRGPDSAAVLERLERMRPGPFRSITCLKGNHEDMMLDFLADRGAGRDRRWLANGGDATLSSYGVAIPDEDGDCDASRRALRRAMPSAVQRWLHRLPLLWQSGTLVAVHAALDPNAAPAGQPDATLLWGHRDFPHLPRADGLWVAHGHTVTRPAIAEAGHIAVDTGAYFTGTLTAALVDPTGAVRFVDTA